MAWPTWASALFGSPVSQLESSCVPRNSLVIFCCLQSSPFMRYDRSHVARSYVPAQRLHMSAFTLPIMYDKTVLVIPAPEANDSLGHQVGKVFEPLTWDLWGVVIGVIVLVALLTVWFNEGPSKTRSTHSEAKSAQENLHRRSVFQRLARPQTILKPRKIAYARLGLDSFLEKGLVSMEMQFF